MTLLTIVQAAADRVGVARPSTVIGNADQTARTMLALAQEEGNHLARRAPWQRLTKEQTFTATATETQSGALPSDFDRFITETFWNRTRKRQVRGPLTSEEWQSLKGWTTSPLVDAFRLRGNDLIFSPIPQAGDTYAYEYVSNQWCRSASLEDRSAWAADTDTGLLDEELMTLGLAWRFLQSSGLDYAEAFDKYERQVANALLRDGGKRTRYYAGSAGGRGPGIVVPEGSWSV